MGAITNTKSKVKKITSKAEGYLEARDLHSLIRKLVPSAPPEAKIAISVKVAGNSLPVTIEEPMNIDFSVVWDENE